MNIAVCVKRIPKTAEADIFIEKDGRILRKTIWSSTSTIGIVTQLGKRPS